MSYILDALKKAEQERGLSVTPVPPAMANSAELSLPRRPAVSARVVLAFFLLGAAGVALLLWQTRSQKESTYTVMVTTARPDPAVHSPLSTPAIMSSVPAPRAPPAPHASKAASARMLAVASPELAPKDAEHIPELRDLPEAIQRDIPALSVSGYIYAEQPADRSIIINRKFLREGDQVASDLLLEKLTPGGMVLNFRGYRYRATY